MSADRWMRLIVEWVDRHRAGDSRPLRLLAEQLARQDRQTPDDPDEPPSRIIRRIAENRP